MNVYPYEIKEKQFDAVFNIIHGKDTLCLTYFIREKFDLPTASQIVKTSQHHYGKAFDINDFCQKIGCAGRNTSNAYHHPNSLRNITSRMREKGQCC